MPDIDKAVVEDILSDYGTVKDDGFGPYVVHKTYGPYGSRTPVLIVATSEHGGFRVVPVDDDMNAIGAEVTVTAPLRWQASATVNWPGTGDKSPEQTRLFMRTLDIAANIATEVTIQRGVPEVSV